MHFLDISRNLEGNHHSGGAVAFETAKDARPARIRLRHEPGLHSVLSLPIVAGSP